MYFVAPAAQREKCGGGAAGFCCAVQIWGFYLTVQQCGVKTRPRFFPSGRCSWRLLTGSSVTVGPLGGVQASSTLANFPLASTVEKSAQIRFVGVWQNQVSWYLLL